MNFNKHCLIVLSIFLILLAFIGLASASDADETQVLSVDESINLENNNEMNILSNDNDDIESNENVLKENSGSYSELADSIDKAQKKGDKLITLNKDCIYTYDSGSTINISTTFTVDGNGATFDMAGSDSRVFYLSSGNIIIKNLIIKNANSKNEQYGGAIYINDGSCAIENCTFINNHAIYGGAIYSNGVCSIKNSSFVNNHGVYGGANYFNSSLNNVHISAHYINNTADKSGGANYFNNTLNNVIIAGLFDDNIAKSGCGGANHFMNHTSNLQILGNFNHNIANSDCNGSDKSGSGGANFFNRTVNNIIISGKYTNNTAFRGGANFFYKESYNVAISGNYKNNTGLLFGGANYFMDPLINASIKGNYTNNKATNNGGANFINKIANNVEITGNYINNSGVEGSAIYFNRAVENISISGNYIDNQGITTVYMIHITEATLTVSDIVFDYNTTGSGEVSFTGATGVNASVIGQPNAIINIINNTIITVSGLDAGTYNLTVTTIGDALHDNVTKNAKITVNKIKAELSANEVIATYNVNEELVITLKDSDGKAFSGVNVTVDLNGAKDYTTDNNSQIKISTKDLVANIYTAKITFNGTANYDETIKNVKVTVKKATPVITAKKKTFKVKTKSKKITATLTSNIKNAMANTKITLKVNGKTWTATTNSKGVATFKVKLTKKGSYKATFKYAGDSNYNAVSKTVTIKIKK